MNELSNNKFFLFKNYFDLLYNLNKTYQTLESLKKDEQKSLNDCKKNLLNKKKMIKNQKDLLEETRKLLLTKEQLFNKEYNQTFKIELDKINIKLEVLLRTQMDNDNKIIQLSYQINVLNKRTGKHKNKIVELEEILNKVKEQIKLEYDKIIWSDLLKKTNIGIPSYLNNIKNNELKEELIKLFKTNVQIENSLIRMIYNCSKQIIKDENFKNISLIIENISFILNVNEKIYKLIYKLSEINKINNNTIGSLKELTSLLNNVLTSTKVDNKIISLDLENLKVETELNDYIVNKNCRPPILFKSQILSQTLISEVVCDIDKLTNEYLSNKMVKSYVNKKTSNK